MNHLYENVAYLKGLAEGMNVEESSKEGKLLLGILDTLEEMIESMEELQEDQDDLAEYVEALDDDLAEVEDGHEDEDEPVYEDDDDDIDFFEIECPKCQESIYLDEDILFDEDAEILCPECHELIEFEEDDFCGDGCCCTEPFDVQAVDVEAPGSEDENQ